MITVSGYEIQEKLRRNQNIDTYRGLRLKDEHQVLIKIPNNEHSYSTNFAILQHEFHLLSKIEVPAIIKPCEFLQNNPTPALILEGVEGELLSNYLAVNQMEISDFFDLATQLVDVVGELHRLNIIHKEIKPANIIIDPNKLTLKLIDLSAATKRSEERFDYLNLSRFGQDLAYISPEQTGRINRPVDYRTDFYSLGITLYEMLTSQLPFQTTDPHELVYCHIAQKPPSVLSARRNIPKMLADIIDKLLEKMPEDRYSSIVGLQADLHECNKRWLLKRNDSDYSLGDNDIKSQLNISRNLYGREREITQLTDSFNRVCHGTKEIILVAGYSGIGKTSLVKEVYASIVRHRGYYIQGKFDQLQRGIPYSAIVAAFQNLVKQVLSENKEKLETIKKDLLHSLSNNGQVVIDVIPEVELIIGEQQPVRELNPTDAQIRFNLVFQNVVRVFARADHPLVILLDDLQWADSSSLNFIENLLQDRETNHLLIIGTYRDNEINDSHALQLSINNLIKNKVALTIFTLMPLQLDNILDLLQDTLLESRERVTDLAQCVFEKTLGNPFFINEFLKLIYQDNLLNFSDDSWEWDLAKIREKSATDNVLSLLSAKIHVLEKSTQETLKLGSCFGYQFDLKTLLIINEQTISETAKQLSNAIKANLIYPLEETYKTLGLIGLNDNEIHVNTLHYRFAHDRIQQATYELIEEPERLKLHLKIGRSLLKEKPLEEHDERLFDVMKHFNQSIALIDDIDERHLLAKYNYWAGEKAKSALAYNIADNHLSAGAELLEPNNWDKNCDLAFKLYKELAVCKYLVGDFTTADKYFCELLSRSQDPLDNLEIHRLNIEMLSTLGKHDEALQMGLAALRDFNIKIPENPNVVHILTSIYKIKFQLRNKDIESLSLPPMKDLQQKAIVNLITQLLNSAFITNQQLFVVLTCKNISLNLKYGYTESTSFAIPVYAFIIMHSLNLYDEAISFVKLYNRLKLQYGESDFEGKNQFVLGSFIEPYQIPIALCNKTVNKAFRLCCDVGDLVYSNYSSLILVIHSLSAGKNLDAIKKNIQSTLSFMARVKSSDFITVAKFWEYSVQCLENPRLAKVERVACFEENIIKGKSKTELSFFYNSLTRLQFLLGNFDAAMQAGQNHELYSDYDKGLICHLDGKLFFALAIFCKLPELPKTQHKLYLKKLKKIGLFIEKYATWCPDNYKSYSLLLKAECACIDHLQESALSFYEQAIKTALTSNLILIAAIASERAAKHCQDLGLERVARLYIQSAYQYFTNWGAITKIKSLEQLYPALIMDDKNSDYTPAALPLAAQLLKIVSNSKGNMSREI